MNSIENFKSKDFLKIIIGVLDIVLSFINFVDVGKFYGVVIWLFWVVVSWLLIENKLN